MLIYSRNRGTFNLSPSFVRTLTEYNQALSAYNGKAKIKLNHLFHFYVSSGFVETLDYYLESLRKKLRNFEYIGWIDDYRKCYNFRKFSKIKNDFKINVQILL